MKFIPELLNNVIYMLYIKGSQTTSPDSSMKTFNFYQIQTVLRSGRNESKNSNWNSFQSCPVAKRATWEAEGLILFVCSVGVYHQ